jgi:hypothetical protein
MIQPFLCSPEWKLVALDASMRSNSRKIAAEIRVLVPHLILSTLLSHVPVLDLRNRAFIRQPHTPGEGFT